MRPADEVNIAAETVQLGDGHMTPEFPCGCQGSLELRTAVQRSGALPCLHLHELTDDLEALALRELSQRVALGLDAEPRAALR
jgi:hypothetical protein